MRAGKERRVAPAKLSLVLNLCFLYTCIVLLKFNGYTKYTDYFLIPCLTEDLTCFGYPI